MAGIDGLRAIAVLAVIAYHLNLGWASGGLLGVGVFFVLSGYLITNLLVAEWERYGHVQFKNFWFRRARRLLPALFIMLAVVISWVTLFKPGEIVSLRGDALAAALYFSNWWYVFHHVSYFAKFGPPSPLTHLWSLAVEEQFYLIWPLLLTFGLRFVRKKSVLIPITIALAAASALAMALMYQPGTDPSRVYYGTDTRAFALLIGAALALAWPSRNVKPPARRAPWALDLIGIAGLAGILWMVWQTNEYQTFLYRGGLVVLSLAAAATIAAVVHPASRLGKILGWKPLRWIGVRSYGIYLWHYPVIVLTSPTVNTGAFNPLRAGLQVAASITLASLSWHFIEEPIRQGAIGRAVERWRTRRSLRGTLRWSTWAASAGLLGILALSIGGLSGWVEAMPVGAPGPSTIGLGHHNHHVHVGGSSANPSHPSAPPSGAPRQASPSSPSHSSSAPATSPSPDGASVTAIGDSVMVDAEPYLKQDLPGIVVSAHVGRQLIQTPPVIARLKAEHKLGQVVILELGNNGPYTRAQLMSLLHSLGPTRQVIMINTRVPMPWQDVVNHLLAQVASTDPQVTLVNWYQASANENGWFYPDGVHLNPTGAQAYARLLVDAVKPFMVRPPANHSSH